MKASREEARRLLDENVADWSGNAEVVAGAWSGTVEFVVPLDGEDALWLADEAERRGVKPGQLLAELVAGARKAAEDEPITIRPSQLHQAIDQATREAA